MAEGNPYLAFLCAVSAATIGTIINRIVFKVKYDTLVMLWLMSAFASFVISLIYGNGLESWFFTVAACAALPAIGYFGYKNQTDTAQQEGPWKIGAGISLYFGSIILILTADWWIKNISDSLGIYSYLPLTISAAILGGTGLAITLTRHK